MTVTARSCLMGAETEQGTPNIAWGEQSAVSARPNRRGDVYAQAIEPLGEARQDLALPGTIADAVTIVARGQRRDIR
jgi:hypothetical protein